MGFEILCLMNKFWPRIITDLSRSIKYFWGQRDETILIFKAINISSSCIINKIINLDLTGSSDPLWTQHKSSDWCWRQTCSSKDQNWENEHSFSWNFIHLSGSGLISSSFFTSTRTQCSRFWCVQVLRIQEIYLKVLTVHFHISNNSSWPFRE